MLECNKMERKIIKRMEENEIRRDYITAKSRVEHLIWRIEVMEHEYIKKHDIVNPDGEIPGRIFRILDNEIFRTANLEISAKIVAYGLDDEYNAALKTLKKAENRLLGYGLSVVPKSMRNILERGMKDYTMRQEMIDLVMRMDISTVGFIK